MALNGNGRKADRGRRPNGGRGAAGCEWFRVAAVVLSVTVVGLCGADKPRELVSLPQGSGCVAFSPDAKTLATQGDGNEIRLWDVATGKERASLEFGGPLAGAGALAFSPDGKLLASGSCQAKVKLWDPATGKELEPVQIDEEHWHACSVAFSPDGKRLASGNAVGEILVWDVSTRKVQLTIQGPRAGTPGMAFSPDGKILASGHGTGSVELWDATTGKELRSFRMSAGTAVISLAYAPDGKAVAAMCVTGPPQVWDLENGRERFTVATGNGGCVAFSPDAKLLAFGTGRGVLTILDAATGEQLVQFQAHKRGVNALAFSPDGKLLATPGSDFTTKIWDVARLLGQKDK